MGNSRCKEAVVDLAVNLAPRHPKGLWLTNSVMTSAGTFGADGYGAGLPEGFPLNDLGAVVMKTTTPHSRQGNPEPQLAQLPAGWLNSIGLANPGIEAVIREKAPLWASWPVPVILSIAGERVEEFQELARRVEGTLGIAALEVNVSCPNVEGGLEFGQRPELAAEVTHRVRQVTSLPVIVKLTPNVTDIVEVARAVEAAGADALTLINTVVGMGIDPTTRRPFIGNVLGGLSGPAMKPVALAAVYRVAKVVRVPIIGVGGIVTGADAMEFFLAGASAVQVGSAALGRPQVYLRVLAGIVEAMESQGVQELSQIIGALQT
ncbi:MAG: dihydroorotate dehydrogenase [Dehalococcoidia bacterium]|nr:dihydroorotate dehydrogenase [Dehalococcoidia bacterium]